MAVEELERLAEQLRSQHRELLRFPHKAISEQDFRDTIKSMNEFWEKGRPTNRFCEFVFVLTSAALNPETGVHINPDRELAEDLDKLRGRAISILEITEAIHPTDCSGLPRGKEAIDRDQDLLNSRKSTLNNRFGLLIQMATPPQEKQQDSRPVAV